MKFEQLTGHFFDGTRLLQTGWSGHGAGKNNPSMENVKDVGVLPRGKYMIEDPVDGTHLGPEAFPLTPDPSNEMYGRGGFYIHGASSVHPEMSSDGCIILGPVPRAYIGKKIGGTPKDSPLRQLDVV